MMDSLAGQRLLILGLARQGKALARFAVSAGARVTISDSRAPALLADALVELEDLVVEFVLGDHPIELLDQCDLIALSGGVPADAPFVQAARDRHIPLTNDSQEFIRRSPTPVVGITGSAGKTTTTALTGAMGASSGRKTWVGGNIGRPLIADLPHIAAGDIVVQELSSFQLELWQQSPTVAGLLNVTPNHLDRHRTMAAYSDAKANILRYQRPSDIAVLGVDDAGARACESEVRGRLRHFSLDTAVADGAFARGGQLWLRDGEREQAVMHSEDLPLPGRHNVANAAAAITLADSAGVPLDAIRQGLRSFRGVPHRLETVATVRGVRFINDSVATAPERVLAALDALPAPVILLAGGQDKAMVWDAWARQVAKRARHIILFGALGPQLEQLLTAVGATNVSRVDTVADAVTEATAVARAGDVILLSPGGTSFDAYPDFAARGEHFRRLVAQLES